MDDPTASASGSASVAGVTPSSGPEMPPPMPAETIPSQVSGQTFVVPPVSEGANPFVPQQAVSSGASGVTFKKKGGSVGKTIFLLLILALLVLGGIFGSQYIAKGIVPINKDVTISYWGLWENDSVVQGIIDDFQVKHPTIKVTYTKQSQRQYRERLQGAIARGEGPDVFRFHNTWIPMLRNDLSAAPADIITASEFAQTFYPTASADLVGGQSVYGMPVMIEGLGLYYNEDIFAAAGATPPTTWEDVLNLVPKLTVKSDATILTSAIALGTTGNVEHFSDIIATMMMQNGAKLTTPTGTQAEEAMLFYRKFANPSDPVYTWNETLDNSISAFANGKVAMIFAPSWRVFDIKQVNPTLRFKIVPIPQLPGNTVTWASYWVEGVSAKSKHNQAAWEFVKYLTSREAAIKLYTGASKTRAFGEPYARVDMGNLISEDPLVGAYIKQAPTARSFPLASRTFDNGINDKLIKYIEDAINAVNSGTSPASALTTASNGFRQVLGSYGLATGTAPASSQ